MVEGNGKLARKLALFMGLAIGLSFGLAAAHAAAPNLTPSKEKNNFLGLAGPLHLEGLAYEIETASGFSGQEALFLQARLKSDGGLITRAIHWRVYRVNEIGGLEPAQNGDSAAFALPAKPGTYRIDIYYGLASLSQTVYLPEGEQRNLTFILDVGGLRMNATLEKQPLPAYSNVIYRVFARNGPNRGRLIAQSNKTGELMRLPAGQYWVENAISGGLAGFPAPETVVGTLVTIQPGILSTLEIDHKVADKNRAANHVDRRRKESAYLPKIMR